MPEEDKNFLNQLINPVERVAQGRVALHQEFHQNRRDGSMIQTGHPVHESPAASKLKSSAPPTILLLDKDRSIHEFCQRHLSRAGYKLISAFDTIAGIEYIRNREAQLVLLDATLARVDGNPVYKEIASNPNFSHLQDVPVIMLTAMSEPLPERHEPTASGLIMHLEKPFSAQELIEAVQNVIVADHLREQERQRVEWLQQEVARMNEENLALQSHLRELQSVIEHATGAPSDSFREARSLPRVLEYRDGNAALTAGEEEPQLSKTAHLSLREARQQWVAKFERHYLIELLNRYHGNISRVARKAGVHRMTIYRMLKHYDITISPRRAQ